MSDDESTKENYMNNLLTLVIWKCVYYRIVFIVKKKESIFFQKGFFKGGHNVAKGEDKKIFCARKKCPPPYTNALVRPCNIPLSESEEYDIFHEFFRCMAY